MKFQKSSETLAVAELGVLQKEMCIVRSKVMKLLLIKLEGTRKPSFGMVWILPCFLIFFFSSGSSFSEVLPLDYKNNKKKVNILAKKTFPPTQNILPENKICVELCV